MAEECPEEEEEEEEEERLIRLYQQESTARVFIDPVRQAAGADAVTDVKWRGEEEKPKKERGISSGGELAEKSAAALPFLRITPFLPSSSQRV